MSWLTGHGYVTASVMANISFSLYPPLPRQHGSNSRSRYLLWGGRGQNLEISKHDLNIFLAKLIQSYWIKTLIIEYFFPPEKEEVPPNETEVFHFQLKNHFSPVSNIRQLCEIKTPNFFILEQIGAINVVVFTFQSSVAVSKGITICTVLAILQDIGGGTTSFYT